MFCAGRVQDEDLKRTMKACGGSIQTSVQNMSSDVLGTCETFEENQIGGERYVYFPYFLYIYIAYIYLITFNVKESFF